jgi:hypothetical protein
MDVMLAKENAEQRRTRNKVWRKPKQIVAQLQAYSEARKVEAEARKAEAESEPRKAEAARRLC